MYHVLAAYIQELILAKAGRHHSMTYASCLGMLLELWRVLLPGRRRQLVALLLLMVLASFFEMLSVGSVLPFLAGLTAPEKVFHHPLMRPLIEVLAISQPGQLFPR